MKKIVFLLALGVFTQVSMGSTVGLGGAVANSMYLTEKKTNTYMLPLLDLEYSGFFLKSGTSNGVETGYNLLETDNYILSLYGTLAAGFAVKSGDMKDGYKSIDKRRNQFMAGTRFTYYPDFLGLKTSLAGAFGKEGGTVDITVSKPVTLTENFTLVPAINYTYYTSGFVDYYFGVQGNELGGEITRTYDGKEAYRYGVVLVGDYRFNEHLSMLIFSGLGKVSSGISNSPIANDDDITYVFGSGLTYTF